MDSFQYSELSKTPDDGQVKDTVSWHWKASAFLSSWLLLAGYIVSPLALDRSENRPRVDRTALIILGSVLVISGYLVSIILCFKRRHSFLLEFVFLPCFGSSLLSLFNVAFNIFCRDLLPLDVLGKLVIGLSAASTVFYALAAAVTYWKTLSSQQPAPPNSWPDDGAAFVTEDEMQRRQLLKLLLNNSEVAPTPDILQSTFRIDIPENINPHRGREQERYLVAPESAYEKRTVVTSPGPIEYGGWRTPDRSADPSPHGREQRRAEIERQRAQSH